MNFEVPAVFFNNGGLNGRCLVGRVFEGIWLLLGLMPSAVEGFTLGEAFIPSAGDVFTPSAGDLFCPLCVDGLEAAATVIELVETSKDGNTSLTCPERRFPIFPLAERGCESKLGCVS